MKLQSRRDSAMPAPEFRDSIALSEAPNKPLSLKFSKGVGMKGRNMHAIKEEDEDFHSTLLIRKRRIFESHDVKPKSGNDTTIQEESLLDLNDPYKPLLTQPTYYFTGDYSCIQLDDPGATFHHLREEFNPPFSCTDVDTAVYNSAISPVNPPNLLQMIKDELQRKQLKSLPTSLYVS